VSNGTFSLTGLSSLFTGATADTSITVVMLSEMTMMDIRDRFFGRPNCLR